MRLISHHNPAHYRTLGVINDHWPIQFLSEYARFYRSYYGDDVQMAFDEELKAYLPIRFLNQKMFNPAQVLFAPMRNGIELPARDQLVFFNRLINLLRTESGCERLIQPQPFGILAAVPPYSKYCEFGTYIIDLASKSNEEILKGFHPKYVKAVTHSIKNEARVVIGRETLNDFYSVYAKTMERAGQHTDEYEFFDTLYKYLGEDRIYSAVVYDQNVPVSGIFVISTLYSAFLTHAGTHGDSKLYGAAKLLNYEMMRYLKQKGVQRYDFVGVRLRNNNPTLEGIFRFKKGFGGDLKEGFLWKKDLLPMKAKAYDYIVKWRSRGRKYFDIIDQVSQ
jgi:lipid II:glycine glycyltransferase (peptidoglycan interpeptide bridge formation enzyme)